MSAFCIGCGGASVTQRNREQKNMKIGILSDTHGSLAAIRKVLASAPPVECWIHCGDFASDANAMHNITGQEVYTVCGNCDAMRGPVEAKPDCYLRLEGFKVWITHGHLYMNETRQIAELAHWGQELEQDIVIFGHTHVPVFTQMNGIWLLNPGSPSRPREGSRAGFVILTLNQGQMPAVEFLEV